MNYAQDNSQSVYRLWAIALGVAIVVVTICGSLGLVWMRQQVSAMAAAASHLQTQIAEAERESAGLDARLARALSPQYLATRLPEGLRPSTGNQIVWSGRAQQLIPAPGFDEGALLAQQSAPVRAGSAVAATTAPASPARMADRFAPRDAQATVAASASAAQSSNHLVSTPQGAATQPVVEEAPLTLTFNPTLLGAQPGASASARR